MQYQTLAPNFQFCRVWSLIGTKHDAVVLGNVNESYAHDFNSMFDRTGTTRPEPANMWSLLARLWYVARIYGYSLQSTFISKVSLARQMLNLSQLTDFAFTLLKACL